MTLSIISRVQRSKNLGRGMRIPGSISLSFMQARSLLPIWPGSLRSFMKVAIDLRRLRSSIFKSGVRLGKIARTCTYPNYSTKLHSRQRMLLPRVYAMSCSLIHRLYVLYQIQSSNWPTLLNLRSLRRQRCAPFKSSHFGS